MSSDRLTDQAHWDAVHHRSERGAGRLRRYARLLLGPARYQYLHDGGYVGHVYREGLLRPHVAPGARMLEVGSAPGLHLAKLARRLDGDPWGLDYSLEGIETNRATFADFGFDPAHAIHADFFKDDFIEAHRDSFDVVMSHGFIEHFREVRPVVARHVALARLGGLVAISIPNLAGLNAALTRYFNPALLDAHNLDIMSKDAFAGLFVDQGLTPIYCDYVGVFQFGLQSAPPSSPKRHLLRATGWMQVPLDLFQRRVFGTRTPHLPAVSPYLYFVGRKHG